MIDFGRPGGQADIDDVGEKPLGRDDPRAARPDDLHHLLHRLGAVGGGRDRLAAAAFVDASSRRRCCAATSVAGVDRAVRARAA